MIIILKNNLWSFKCMCFCDQTHGRTNQLPLKITFFSFEKHNGIIKQIMTGPSGNNLSICPLRFRIASPRVPIDLGCASVNRNSWGGDPESLGANRSAYYPRDQSLFV